MYKGIDISYWQGAKIDWAKVKASGITFAYIKATEGKGRKEPLAMSQANGAKLNNIKVGYYHFAHTENNAIAEAKFFAEVLKGLPPSDLIPVLDIEANKAGLKPDAIELWINNFIVTLQAAGINKIMLYSYGPFFNACLTATHPFGKYPLWLAQYRNDAKQPTLPRGWNKYSIWQYTQTGKVNGIDGNVDMNNCEILPTI